MTQIPGTDRVELANVLPLSTPYSVMIFSIYKCNFRCVYCRPEKLGKKGFDKNVSEVVEMDFKIYEKLINDMKGFKEKIKVLSFAGLGEPLLNKRIHEMISIAKKADIANNIDIVSNAGMLTPKITNNIVNAGLSNLRISLQGLTNEDYKKNAGVNIDFNKLVENITYFYRNKKNTKLHLKIMDYMLKEPNSKEKFYEIFSPISDTLNIENLVPLNKNVDYSEITPDFLPNKARTQEKAVSCKVCPKPFYMMVIAPDGNIMPCCYIISPINRINVKEANVVEVWNGEEFNNFRKKCLDINNVPSLICQECEIKAYINNTSDLLDEHIEKLRLLY